MRLLITVLGLLLVTAVWSLPATAAPEYTGSKSCGKCHRKDRDGEQYPIWQKSGHAKAFEVLKSDEAKQMAGKMGVSGDPQKAEACLACHTTGFGAPEDQMGRRFDMADGVQCEACHGPGSEYDSNRTMKKIREELSGGSDCPTCEETGFMVASEETCKTCHSESITVGGKTYKNPTWKGSFNYDEMWGKIKHPIPQ